MGSPSGILVGNFGLFPAEIACKVLRLDSIRSEVEELLLEDETPKWQAISATISSIVDKCIDARSFLIHVRCKNWVMDLKI